VTELERELRMHPKQTSEPERVRSLKRKARVVLALFMVGLVLAGPSARRSGRGGAQQLVGEAHRQKLVARTGGVSV
jgi:hypothetical protein